MSAIYPIEAVFKAVVERFKEEGVDAENRFGWREPARQMTAQRRIVWIPGDPANAVGTILGAKKNVSPYRSLGTLQELFTVEISASDTSAPEDELAQYRATRLLYDYWFRAVYHASGMPTILSMEWETRRTERRRGTLLRVVFALDANIPDESADPADGLCVLTSEDGLRAEGDVDLLDVSEHFETAPAPEPDPEPDPVPEPGEGDDEQ